jgi:OmpA-OmpF porin, OOP family
MSTYIDTLSSLADPVTNDIAERLGESPDAVAQATDATFATILAGIIGRIGDAQAFQRLFNIISEYAGDSVADEGGYSSTAAAATAPDAESGTSLLNELFGEHWPAVTNGLASVAGFRNAASAWSFLSLLSPIALDFLARNVREGGLDATQLAKELLEQKAAINASAPPGLMTLLSSGQASRAPNDSAASQRRRVDVDQDSTGASSYRAPNRGWVLGMVAVLSLILLLFGLVHRSSRRTRAASSRAAAVDTVGPLGGRVVDTAGGEVSSNPTTSLTTLTLPTGVMLHIPKDGFESRLVGFIRDSSQRVSDTTWFEFDRVQFVSGSTTLTPESHEQLNNVAAILHAYPNVSVKVAGYTDNQGRASANRRLARQRASAVKQELFRRGVAGNRLQVVGYGEAHPIANSASEDARVALRVTAK